VRSAAAIQSFPIYLVDPSGEAALKALDNLAQGNTLGQRFEKRTLKGLNNLAHYI